jgi:hypothetical protein
MDDFDVDVSHLAPVKLGRCRLGVPANQFSNPITTLIGKHAGRGNAAFINAIMKLDGEYSTVLTARQLDDGDLRRAEVFARTVITDWDGPRTKDGTPAAYTPERLMKYFTALIEAKRSDVVVAALRYFADPDNFVEGAAASEVLGKG